MGVYEDVCYENAKDIELEQKHITYDMPSEQQINILNTQVLQNHIEKKQNDCKVVFNQINKNLHHAVFSNTISKAYSTFFTHTFNSALDIDISNCKGFDEYSKQLLDRGIRYTYVPDSICKNNSYTITYRPLEKTIYLFGR